MKDYKGLALLLVAALQAVSLAYLNSMDARLGRVESRLMGVMK